METEKERVSKFHEEKIAKLEERSIYKHILKVQQMEEDAVTYFHFVCPIMKAIAKDIEQKHRLYVPPADWALLYHRGSGPVSFRNQRIYIEYKGKSKIVHHFSVDVMVNIICRTDTDTHQDGSERDDTINLSPPVSLLENFKQSVFDEWADEVKEKREAEQKKEELDQLLKLVKKHRGAARNFLTVER